MSPLDELRKALNELYRGKPYIGVMEAIDTFAASHPGLADLSTCGPQCPAWTNGGCHPDWCAVLYLSLSESSHAPTGQPCPVLKDRP